MTRLDFRILGPLEVQPPGGAPLDLGARKQRAVLALLLLDPGRVVSLDRIINGLWTGEAPSSATSTLQVYISQLRRVLEPDRPPRTPPSVLVTRDPGYLLAIDAGQVDAARFTRGAEDGRAQLAAGAYAEAETLLTAALREWRGGPLADFADEEFAAAVAAQLGEVHDGAVEDLVDVHLATGRHAAAAAASVALLDRHPFRERPWGQLMLALYRDGRQADALAAFRRARTVLDEELGLPPGPHLRDLEAAILRHDPALTPSAGSPGFAAPPRAALQAPPSAVVKAPPGGVMQAPPGGVMQAPPGGVMQAPPGGVMQAPPGSAAQAPPGALMQTLPGAAVQVAERPPGTVLVGRGREERHLDERLAQAAAGQGGVVLVVGEAGLGKTLLAERAAALAEGHGLRVAWSRCVEASATPAFWPWAQILRALPDTDGRRHLLDVLAGRGESGWRAEEPGTALFHLHEAVAETLSECAAGQPLLLVVDDLHVADASSLQLLAHLAPALHRRPILLLGTMRPDVADGDPALRETLALLANERGADRIRLGSFTAGDVAAYLHDSAGGDAPGEVVVALLERTGGNPFYLKELLRLLTSEHPGGWGTAQAVADLDVPEGVRDVVGRRVSRLPEATQAMLRTAAVIGRDVELVLLEAGTDAENEQVMSALEPAVVAGLLTEVPGTWDYRFSHAIVRDTLYGALTRLQRSRLHLRVGEALEAFDRPDDPALLGRLVHHFTMAARLGGAERAVGYARRAADLSMAQLAYDEAAAYLEAALGALDPTRPGAAADRCRLLVQLGAARRAGGDLAGTRAVLDEALTLARQLGDDDLTMDAATLFGGVTLWTWRPYLVVDERMIGILRDQLARLGDTDPRRRAVLLGTLAVELYHSEDRPAGEAHAAEAVALARRTGDAELLARTLNNLWNVALVPQAERLRRAAVDELLAIDGLPRTVELTGRLHRMMNAVTAGDVAGFETDLARAVHLGEELRTGVLAAQVRYARAGRAMLDGRWDDGERLVGEAFALQAHTSLWGTNWIRLAMLYTSRRFQGRPGELLDELVRRADEPHLELLRPTAVLAACESGDEDLARRLVDRWGTRREMLWCWNLVAFQWALVAARLDLPPCAELYEEILPFADQWSTVGTGCATWGSMRYALAELAERLGRPDESVAHATLALEAHRRLGAAHLEAASIAQVARLSGA
ncbi:BTAD domain-containing putative transcriptional regulator [Dactylosporangium maewongense]|uniref:BTAD domain-containing putative transcriptional regulator n=1 Tax=Dactylosporangium maewongense TaxID=634393 RepID=UPI0031E22108